MSADRAGALRPSIVFAGSLLPVRYLLEYGDALHVKRIVVLNRTHQRSFEYVAQRLPGASVSRLAGGPLLSSLMLAAHLMWAKLRGRRVVFFHECCWPVFDLLVSRLRPRGLFVPQVHMNGFETLADGELPPTTSLSRRIAFVLFGWALRDFIVYRMAKDSAEPGFNYYFSMRSYPDTIEVAPVWRPAGRRDEPLTSDTEPRVILIGGTEPVPDATVRDLYSLVTEVAVGEGYAVFFKDHPMHGIKFEHADCTVIDPARPMETITEGFAFSIGVASTAIFGAGARKISIMPMLEAMPAAVREVRRTRLLSHPESDADRLEFIDNLDLLRQVLREARSAPLSRDTCT